MKREEAISALTSAKSPPTRGAWIETSEAKADSVQLARSPPTRGAWIETYCGWCTAPCMLSPPTRGAWIETAHQIPMPQVGDVAPHAGGVD